MLESDERYPGSLQERKDIEEEHAALLGLEWCAQVKPRPTPTPMTRKAYLEYLRKRFPRNNWNKTDKDFRWIE